MMKSLDGYKNAASSEFRLGLTNPRPIVLSGFNYANEMAHRRLTVTDPLGFRGFRVSAISSRLRPRVRDDKSLAFCRGCAPAAYFSSFYFFERDSF